MIRRSLALFLILLAYGCTVGPDFKRPVVPVPKHWSEAPKDNHKGLALAEQWWKTFNDPVLNQLITDAVAANLDLKQALVRVKEARAQRWITITTGLPGITGKSNLSRRFNNSTATSQTGGAPSSGGSFGIGNQVINIFQSGFDAQWELDFFGGIRRAVEAADATVDS